LVFRLICDLQDAFTFRLAKALTRWMKRAFSTVLTTVLGPPTCHPTNGKSECFTSLFHAGAVVNCFID
jgi:hypothetical protein